MGFAFAQAREIQERFTSIYLQEPYTKHTRFCAISSPRQIQKTTGQPIELREGELLEDLCLWVGVNKPITPESGLPKIFYGMRVFYSISQPKSRT